MARREKATRTISVRLTPTDHWMLNAAAERFSEMLGREVTISEALRMSFRAQVGLHPTRNEEIL